MSLAAALLAELDGAALDELAELLAPRLAARLAAPRTGWLDAAGAAEHLSTSRGRLYDLVALGKLQPRRDGRRLLFRIEDLDAYAEASA